MLKHVVDSKVNKKLSYRRENSASAMHFVVAWLLSMIHRCNYQNLRPGCFLGFDSWGCRAQSGGQVWVGLECLTKGRCEGLVYH